VLSKRKPAARAGKIVLLNASKHVKKGKPKNYIPEEELRPLATSFLKGEAVEGEIAVITTEQASAADYNLSPSRWVEQGEESLAGSIPVILKELASFEQEQVNTTKTILELLQPLIAKGTE
jgi:type I restriction enzyme M protein